jgi:hypothetical protein
MYLPVYPAQSIMYTRLVVDGVFVEERDAAHLNMVLVPIHTCRPRLESTGDPQYRLIRIAPIVLSFCKST